MKKTGLTSRTLAALMIMQLAGVAVPVMHASDYFPLDVWEEMAAWQPGSVADERLTGRDGPPMSIKGYGLETVQTSFPFDVWKELNDLGSMGAPRADTFDVGYGRSEKYIPVPYWLPEELHVP
ncbi:hypothetical protein DSCA_58330 [Desulfosarcina alkanivorans]|uniref:Uncharacterized protein n=1 Tax=Desulfosarcina alkanivorans TaxID=571177 RepID=A0A5K7YV63_9BACT|nr:hypothetical protein [Desulfosarcina alkanivorans]BBO71903.1 hypothetical protein DSCA_58330 [Desulfosarcina alkanivorans]